MLSSDELKLLEQKLIARRVIANSGCWEYTGAIHSAGYGALMCNYKNYTAHRLSMMIFKPLEFKDHLCVLHRCNNPICFNPEHLYMGTQEDNARDRTEAGHSGNSNAYKKSCPQGHEYTPDNLYVYHGRRSCKTCAKQRAATQRLLNSL